MFQPLAELLPAQAAAELAQRSQQLAELQHVLMRWSLRIRIPRRRRILRLRIRRTSA